MKRQRQSGVYCPNKQKFLFDILPGLPASIKNSTLINYAGQLTFYNQLAEELAKHYLSRLQEEKKIPKHILRSLLR